MASQQRLKELLDYCSETGVFKWKTSRGTAIKGKVAGSNDKDGYIKITVDGKSYQAHRLAWFYIYGVWPNKIDHNDRVKNNNSIANLFDSDHAGNMKNRPLQSNNISGCHGVRYDHRINKWTARISAKYLGSFSSKSAAIQCRKEAEAQNDYHPNHGG